MKFFSILACAVLMAAMTGCSGDEESASSENAAPAADVELVVFNVPALHWGNCAASAIDALASLPGVAKVKTDVGNRRVTCELAPDVKFNVEAALTALADAELPGTVVDDAPTTSDT